MADDEMQQHSLQKNNLAALDPNYLKLRLDTQKLHQDILNFLQGTRTVIEFDEKTGTYFEKVEDIGTPLANKEGIQALLSMIVAIVNSHTIQGNTRREELNKVLYYLELGLAERLTLNYARWGIDADIRDQIMDTVMPMVQLILTRTIDNEERKGLTVGIERVSSYYSKDKNKKVL